MHAILVSLGTSGDIFPYVGLGAALVARGHEATLVAPGEFESCASQHGLSFHPLVSAQENHEVLSNPDFWHPIKGPHVGSRWGRGLIERQYRLILGLTTKENAVMVANPAALGATMAAEKAGRPRASIILQPWMIPSSIAPPVMLGHPFPRFMPRWTLKVFWRLLDHAAHLLIGRHVNRLRAAAGLRPVQRVLDWLSRELVLGMFPEWYGPPQTDWPPQLRLVGFPMFDGTIHNELPAELLNFCRAGAPPIVFTFGTGMMHASRVFNTAIDACRRMEQRAIFLTKYRDQLPSPLPAFVRHFEFAPFQQLFPHCAAVVHHGGIGTVAKALAAGIPQLILPWAFDQTDNGVRVKRLGAGDYLRQSRITGASLVTALQQLLTPKARHDCQHLAARFNQERALDLAADLVELLAQNATMQPNASAQPMS